MNIYLRQIEIRRHFVKTRHLRAVWELLKNPQSKRQALFDLSALFAKLQLLQFLNIFVQLEIVQDHGDEKAQYDLKKIRNRVNDMCLRTITHRERMNNATITNVTNR